MAAARAIWKGWLKVSELSCPVALYAGASTSGRISFHTLNRATGNRVHRELIDSETETPVGKDDQVKGFEIGEDDYVVLEPDEIAAAVPESDKTLNVASFAKLDEVDTLHLDRPYFITPASETGKDTYALLREAMADRGVAALARAVLFRRVRTVLIRPHGRGLIGSTLKFDYEVRSAAEAFDAVPEIKIEKEMLSLARHIIETKRGAFDPSTFEDRYEDALAELIKAKGEGRTIEPRKERRRENVVDLMEALRKSAGVKAEKPKRAAAAKTPAQKRRSAG